MAKRVGLAGVAAVLMLSIYGSGTALGAPGGLPGTGDTSFDPAGDTGDNHCVSWDGADANELLGISEVLVAPWCWAVPAGQFWVPFFASAWNLNDSWQEVPADYTPSASTPLEDFLSKIGTVTFTVDPGTRLERSFRYAAEDLLDVRRISDFFPISGPDLPTALFLAKLPPMPPGEHVIAVFIEMTARHCDGLGTGPLNCLPAGTGMLGHCPFIVLPHSPAAQP